MMAVSASAATIEKDAHIFGAVKGRMDIVEALVESVKAYGHKCDSVSAASDNVFSKGFTLKCNHFNYAYEILDKGGTLFFNPRGNFEPVIVFLTLAATLEAVVYRWKASAQVNSSTEKRSRNKLEIIISNLSMMVR